MTDEHAACDTAWECRGCGQDVCPRCEVSPGENDQLCSDCWWTDDPGDAA